MASRRCAATLAAQAIEAGGPWGQGFPEPLFDDRFEILSGRIVGERHWKLVLRHPDGGGPIDGIAFGLAERLPELPRWAHLAYRLDVNHWQGREQLQLRVEHLEPV